MTEKAFQDRYREDFAHCYGCGRLNHDGLQIKSYWDGEQSVCRFTPRPAHTGGFPGFLYGGLIASLIDCHGAGTAAAARARADGDTANDSPLPRFVTASLKVDYLKPTPVDTVLELRGDVQELNGRKAVIGVKLFADGDVCAKGQVLMIQVREE